MNTRRHTEFVREGAYAAEVDVELIEEGNGWSPCLSVDDARKLDAVRRPCGVETSKPHPVLPACSASRPCASKWSGEQARAADAAAPRG
jgi:hypothetical protein